LKKCQRKIILVIEDDECIRKAVVGYIEELGYDTLEAENGIEALKIVDKAFAQITDLKMPEMTGEEYIEELEKRSHDIRFRTGICTGNTDGHKGYPCLFKPFSYTSIKELMIQIIPEDKERLDNLVSDYD